MYYCHSLEMKVPVHFYQSLIGQSGFCLSVLHKEYSRNKSEIRGREIVFRGVTFVLLK